MDNTNNASNTYSAKQQEEIRNIRQKYVPREENKMEQLKKLDEGTKKPGTTTAIAVGAVSSLVMGVGLCCTMVWTDFFVPGIVIGIVGIIGIGLAYPLYTSMTKKRRKKLAPEILRLSGELLQ